MWDSCKQPPEDDEVRVFWRNYHDESLSYYNRAVIIHSNTRINMIVIPRRLFDLRHDPLLSALRQSIAKGRIQQVPVSH